VLDIRNQLDLTWRACLRLEPRLPRRLVTSLNENTFHHFPPYAAPSRHEDWRVALPNAQPDVVDLIKALSSAAIRQGGGED
jgi:hypothetical protein